jgi:hypothetical protein
MLQVFSSVSESGWDEAAGERLFAGPAEGSAIFSDMSFSFVIDSNLFYPSYAISMHTLHGFKKDPAVGRGLVVREIVWIRPEY